MPLFVTSINPIIKKVLEDRQNFARMKDTTDFHSEHFLTGITKWYHERQSFARLISNAKIETTSINTPPFYLGISLPQSTNATANNSTSILSGTNNYANYTGYNSPSANAKQNQVAIPLAANSESTSESTSDQTYDSDIRNKWILSGGIEFNNQMASGFTQLYSSDRNVPLPGITDITVQNKGAFGSTREAKIKYVAHTIEQLEMLEMLYMTLGVFCVLEWGWSLLPDGSLNTERITSDDMKKGLPVVEQLIREKSSNSQGHYDAMMGKISGFNWSNREGGGYECETTLISMAGAFLSMDTKSSSRGFGMVPKSGGSTRMPVSNIEQSIEDLKNAIEIVGYEKTAFFIDSNNKQIPFGFKLKKTLDSGAEDQYYVTWGIIEDYILTHSLGMLSDQYKRNFHNQGILGNYLSALYSKDFMPKKPYDYDQLFEFKYNEQQGSMNLCMGAVPTPISFSNIFPAYNSYNTKIFNDPYLYSADPRICILPGQAPSEKFTLTIYDDLSRATEISGVNTQTEVPARMAQFAVENDVKKGYIRNICINLEFVKKKYDETSTVDEFIIGIFNEINSSCGEPWKFGTFVDERLSNTISMVDLGAWSENEPEPFLMSINGLDSIVRNSTINTDVDAKMQTQTMYGANKEPGEQSTSSKIEGYSFWGRGVVDQNFSNCRPVDTDVITFTSERKLMDLTPEGLVKTLSDTKSAVTELCSNETVASAKQALHNYLVRTFGGLDNSEDKNKNYTIMLPVKLSVTIDGLSGLIFGNALRAKPIPKRYNDCWFTITNVSHALTGNDWTTTLETVLRIRLPKDKATISSKVQNPDYANDYVSKSSGRDNIQHFRIGDYTDIAGKFANPANGKLMSGVQQSRSINGKSRPHKGIDISSRAGGNIFAAYDGTVETIGLNSSSAGNYIIIKHVINGKAYYSRYMHMKKGSLKVKKKGEVVKKGQVIGEMGNTGHCSPQPPPNNAGTHLHFSISDTLNESDTNMNNGYVYDPIEVIQNGRINWS